MPTLEDFQNILQGAQQERIQKSPLYQKMMTEQMLEQKKMQEIPQELLPVFDEIKGTQERNRVRNKLGMYNEAVKYKSGGYVNRFDGTSGPSFMNQFKDKYLGIGQFPDYDDDFIAANGLQYLPYSKINLNGADPETIRIANQGNATMHAWDDDGATYLADANGNLVTGSMLSDMTRQYINDNYGRLLDRAFLSNPDKYWEEKSRYNRLNGGMPIEKPIEPVAPEFYALAGGAHALRGLANKGLASAMVDPVVNMELTDAFINNTTPYNGWGNMMAENAGGPEWAWDLAHPAFAKDLWNLTKAAGKGTYNWMAKHTPESAYNLGAANGNPFASWEPFNWDDFVRAGGYVDESMAGNISDDALRAANSSRTAATDAANESTRTVRRPAYLSGTPTEDDAIQQLMRQHGMSRAEAEDVLHLDRDFEDFWGTEPAGAEGTGVEDLVLPPPPEEINIDALNTDLDTLLNSTATESGRSAVASAAQENTARTRIFPRNEDIENFLNNNPTLDADDAMDALYTFQDASQFTPGNREALIDDFVDAYGVPRDRAAQEVDQILSGTHPDFHVNGLTAQAEPGLPTYEEVMKNPDLLQPFRGRLRNAHPNMPAGISKEEMMQRYHQFLDDFKQRPMYSTYEALNENYSGDSSQMILNNIFRIQRDMIKEGKFPGIMKVEPAGTGWSRNQLNTYGKVNWGTAEAPANMHLQPTTENGVFEMPYHAWGTDGRVTMDEVASWPTAQQIADKLNRRLGQIYDQYVPYSKELENFGRDNFKVTLDHDTQNFVVPKISWVFRNGGPINTEFFNYPVPQKRVLANGGTTNSEQLWSKARPLYNELIAAGVPHMAAIGVLGNIALESGVNPNASNKTNGGHWGYTQNDKAITNHIKKYYGGTGHKEQMQFLKDGLTGQIRGANQAKWLQKRFDEYRQSINGVSDPAKAALMWEKYYEKSANEALDKRADYAKYFHDMLGSPDYQYSSEKYNNGTGLGPLAEQATEAETQVPWYNQYNLNDADYAALYEPSGVQLPMLDMGLSMNPMQLQQQNNAFPNLFAGGGYIEDGLRSLGVNGFKVTSGYRGQNSKVGKAGSRSGHAHKLSDGSSGAIDIVPTDKSSAGWARLEQQLRSPKVQQFLASFGGTILDERDAATMKKTGATGQHFHIGLGVKGGGNFYNQSAAGSDYARRSPVSVFSPIQSSTFDDGSTAPWYAQGNGMTDEDWAALYNTSQQQLIPTSTLGTFPQLF